MNQPDLNNMDHCAQDAIPTNFHEGERMAQARVGMQEKMAPVGLKAIRDYMPDQHREFFSLLPFLLLGACDGAGQVWASVLAHPAGATHSPEPTRLHVGAQLASWDALAGCVQVGVPAGLLGIQAHTRRRNRLNGVVMHSNASGFDVAVNQSFGNCPKYIQAREAVYDLSRAALTPHTRVSDGLEEDMRRIAQHADTFFIASMHPLACESVRSVHGIDVSHRGGKPGFVQVEGDCLTVPDYSGNFFFNTLGNLLLQRRAGLLFIDFERGDVLQLAAEASIVWEGPEVKRFAGAQRLMKFRVIQSRLTPAALPLRWGEATLSPYLEQSGA